MASGWPVAVEDRAAGRGNLDHHLLRARLAATYSLVMEDLQRNQICEKMAAPHNEDDDGEPCKTTLHHAAHA